MIKCNAMDLFRLHDFNNMEYYQVYSRKSFKVCILIHFEKNDQNCTFEQFEVT